MKHYLKVFVLCALSISLLCGFSSRNFNHQSVKELFSEEEMEICDVDRSVVIRVRGSDQVEILVPGKITTQESFDADIEKSIAVLMASSGATREQIECFKSIDMK